MTSLSYQLHLAPEVGQRLGLDSGLGVEKALREYVEMLDIAFPHGLLSRLELRALADLLENLNVNVRSASKLGDLLDEACEVGNLHLRWEVDREGLVSKLRGCPPAECWAIIERLRRWLRETTDERWSQLGLPEDSP